MNKHRGDDAVAHLRSIVAGDPEIQEEYDRLGPRYEAIMAVVTARRRQKLSQRDLADRMGVSQSVLGRLESGANSPTVDSLAKVAKAMGMKLQVRLVRETPATYSAPVEAPARRRKPSSGRPRAK